MKRRSPRSRRNQWEPVQAVESLEVRQVLAAFPVGAAIIANHHPDTANSPNIVATANGGFLSVWRDSFLEGDGGGIYARRFSATGAPVGAAFRVNNNAQSDQQLPAVATLPNGRISFVWVTSDGSLHTDFRRYNGTGTPFDTSSRVIDGSWGAIQPSRFNYPTYASDLRVFGDAANNTWIVSRAWDGTSDQQGFYFVRRLNGNGVQTAAFTIDLLVGYKGAPANISSTRWGQAESLVDFTVTAGGELVASYEMTRMRFVQDVGYRYDHRVLMRRFSSTGVQLNDIVLHNQTTTSFGARNPGSAQLSLTPEGNIGVAWKNGNQDLVYQAFSTAGTALTTRRVIVPGSTFNNRANMATEFDMAILPNGNLVVAWSEPIPFGDDTMMVREFNANGVPLGPAVSFDNSSRYVKDLRISAVSNNHAYVTWERIRSVPSHGNRNIVVQKIGLGSNTPPLVGGVYNVAAEAGGAPTNIVPGITVRDTDSPNLDGHQLRIRISAGGHSSNRLSFRNPGIVVSDGNVSVGGVVIGTIAAQDGVGTRPLHVNLNSQATVARTQRLLRALVFRTTTRNSSATRVVEISIADASGVFQIPASLEIDLYFTQD